MLTTRILAGAIALACVLLSASAEARHRHYRHAHVDFSDHLVGGKNRHHHRTAHPIACQITSGGGAWLLGEACAKRFDRARKLNAGWLARQAPIQSKTEIVPHPAGCPATLFCGCGAAVRIFGAPIRSLWLAANWLRFPRAEPAPGMAAVRQHHVFVIERVLGNGLVVAYDANSGGGRTRIHTISLAGYRVVNPRG